jgi:PIN domain nuclease of toxin-antitoxin system
MTAPRKLSKAARDAVDRADQVGFCTISCWEIAMLVERGRIELDREVTQWVAQAVAHPRATAMPLTSEIAVNAALLGREAFPTDPADRIIYATARAHGAKLITRDRDLRTFDPRATVW